MCSPTTAAAAVVPSFGSFRVLTTNDAQRFLFGPFFLLFKITKSPFSPPAPKYGTLLLLLLCACCVLAEVAFYRDPPADYQYIISLTHDSTRPQQQYRTRPFRVGEPGPYGYQEGGSCELPNKAKTINKAQPGEFFTTE